MKHLTPPTLAPRALEKLLTNHPLIASAVLGSLLLGACASTPTPSSTLVEARSVVRDANASADVQAMAPLELKRANDTLQRANRMLDDGQAPEEVDSAAYVAQRQAETAVAVAQAKGQDAGIAAAELDRERARGDMRTRQAERAQARAGMAQTQAGMARQQAALSEQRASGAEQRAGTAEQRAGTAEERARAAERTASGALLQAAASDATAAESQQQMAQLQQRLAELQARPTDRGMLVTLGDVLFEFNRAEIKPGAQDGLRKLADFLRQYPGRQILIEGHTDSIGAAGANEALSRRRAQAVDLALADMGVAPQRMTIAGYGEDYPVADNATDTNRALNRRVEVYIGDAGQSVRARR
jgi:outer membrane protein OmpA-like peptidoglycan-associated protein